MLEAYERKNCDSYVSKTGHPTRTKHLIDAMLSVVLSDIKEHPSKYVKVCGHYFGMNYDRCRPEWVCPHCDNGVVAVERNDV